MTSNSILIMCLADPTMNPRPNRLIGLCKKMGFNVDIASYPFKGSMGQSDYLKIKRKSDNPVKKIIRFCCRLFLWLWPFDLIKDDANNYYYGSSSLNKQAADKYYSLIVVENLQLLPQAFNIKKSAKILFDAREYYPLQNEDNHIFRIFEKPERLRLCNKYLSKCDKVITVAKGISKKYKEEFNIECDVIRSVPEYSEYSIQLVSNKKINMVYHGAAHRNRCIENMINIALNLDKRFTLDLFLVGDNKYIDELTEQAKNYHSVNIKKPVLFDDILPTLNSYDIGLYYLEPTGFNTKYSLPNKLFEFIQARLMVAIGPSPEMKYLVEQYNCGVVAESFNPEAMVTMLTSLTTKEIIEYKNNSSNAAKELCFEVEGKKLENIIQSIILEDSE